MPRSGSDVPEIEVDREAIGQKGGMELIRVPTHESTELSSLRLRFSSL